MKHTSSYETCTYSCIASAMSKIFAIRHWLTFGFKGHRTLNQKDGVVVQKSSMKLLLFCFSLCLYTCAYVYAYMGRYICVRMCICVCPSENANNAFRGLWVSLQFSLLFPFFLACSLVYLIALLFVVWCVCLHKCLC